MPISGPSTSNSDESRRPRLRSQKREEDEFNLDFSTACLDSSLSLDKPIAHSINILRKTFPTNIGISGTMKEILRDAFDWKIFPSNASGTPSMILGANYLARLLGK
jgi:hypothetical protein